MLILASKWVYIVLFGAKKNDIGIERIKGFVMNGANFSKNNLIAIIHALTVSFSTQGPGFLLNPVRKTDQTQGGSPHNPLRSEPIG